MPVRVAGGIMHAKVSLLVWTGLVRLIVASAKLTPTGYRTNQEIFGVLEHVPGQDEDASGWQRPSAFCARCSKLRSRAATTRRTSRGRAAFSSAWRHSLARVAPLPRGSRLPKGGRR